MRWAIPGSSRAKLTYLFTLQGGFHELHNEPEFKDGLIMKAVEWTLKRIDTPNQAGTSSGADKPKL